MDVMKVKSWGKGQGDYVEINTEDFDLKVHKKYDDKPAKKPATKEPVKAEG